MDAHKGSVAHQGLLLWVAGVGEGEGAEKRDGVTHDQRYHQQFKYRLSQVHLNR